MKPRLHLRDPELSGLLNLWLAEDLGAGDRTTQALLPVSTQCKAVLHARQAGSAAGLALWPLLFRKISSQVKVRLEIHDGQNFKAKQVLARLKGPAWAVLAGERLALNLAQHLSGIATLTARFKKELRGTRAQLLDTRKTTPGLRLLEKYAVLCGGGSNHRMRLDDAILIKDNHLASGLSPAQAVLRARLRFPRLAVMVEVDSLAQLKNAMLARPDVILIDNLKGQGLRKAVALLRQANQGLRRKMLSEASGGITLKNVRAVAKAGVDRISVGALTHSAPAIDLGLDFEIL